MAFLAILFFVFWLVELVPYETAWGDLGSWASAIFTGGGLIFAGISALAARDALRADTRQKALESTQRRAEEENSKAVVRNGLVLRCTWTYSEDPCETFAGKVSYRLSNESPHPFYNCKILIFTAPGDGVKAERAEKLYELSLAQHGNARALDSYFQGITVGTILPSESVSGTLEVLNRDAMPGWESDKYTVPDLYFTDIWGNHWHRPRSSQGWIIGSDVSEEYPQCMCCGIDPREDVGNGN